MTVDSAHPVTRLISYFVPRKESRIHGKTDFLNRNWLAINEYYILLITADLSFRNI